MKTSEMWIFIWTATQDQNPSAEAFSDFESAWSRFGELKVRNFPHYIQRIEIYGESDPESTFFNWCEFVDLNVQQAVAG